MAVQLRASAKLPTRFGEFGIHAFSEAQSGREREHLALSFGEFQKSDPLLVRVHSSCVTGDALFSMRCDCGFQLEKALDAIATNGSGLVLYLDQEGRGIGLTNKLRAYALQDAGADTLEANEKLGFAPDERNYGVCRDMVAQLGASGLAWQLMTNNPTKLEAIKAQGIHVVKRLPLVIESQPYNRDYLRTKRERLGHLL